MFSLTNHSCKAKSITFPTFLNTDRVNLTTYQQHFTSCWDKTNLPRAIPIYIFDLWSAFFMALKFISGIFFL